MSGFRVEVTNQFDETVDHEDLVIDLRDPVSIDEIVRAGRVLRAKRAAELGDMTLADSIDLKLETTDY